MIASCRLPFRCCQPSRILSQVFRYDYGQVGRGK